MDPILAPFKVPQPAPYQSKGLLGWLRINFFSSWFNSLITLLLIYVVFNLANFLIHWAFIDAVWFGDSAKSCPNSNGACWAFVTDRWRLFVYGLYPKELYWRVNIAYLLGAITVISFLYSYGRWTKYFRITMVIVFPILAYIFLVGDSFDLQYVAPENFGGLLLTLVIASISILGSTLWAFSWLLDGHQILK